METKVCRTCTLDKNLESFQRPRRNGNFYYYPNCKNCTEDSRKKSRQKYVKENKNALLERGRARYSNNIEQERKRSRKYVKNNKMAVKERRKLKARELRKTDPSFNLKSNISRAIRHAFKKNNILKNGKSISNYLGYSMQELKTHIESQFESWMTWNNQGFYNPKTWDNNDQNTWTWQLDHIIPQSDLLYTLMEDENFKKCWALSNLRPLSSKENLERGLQILIHKRMQ